MKITTVASSAQELGELPPNWHPAELDHDMSLRLTYRSHDDNGDMTYPFLRSQPFAYGNPSQEQIDAAPDLIRPLVSIIDTQVRDLKQINPDQPTKIGIDYRVGLGRSITPLGNILARLTKLICKDKVFISASEAHFDSFTEGVPEYTTVIASHRGTPTLIYEGPMFRPAISESSEEFAPIFYGADPVKLVNRVLSLVNASGTPSAFEIPEDRTVIVDENTTYHRMQRQWYSQDAPTVFVRANVAVQTEDDDRADAVRDIWLNSLV